MAKDVNFGSVALLMHMDGADNGTSFADVKGKGVSVFGNTTTKTAVKKFGTASAYFGGNGDYLTLPNNPNAAFDTGDFTIEAWIRVQDFSSATAQAIVLQSNNAGPGWGLYVNNLGTCFLQCSEGSPSYVQSPNSRISAGQWHHIAAVRSGTITSVFIDGTRQAFGSPTILLNSTDPMQIGGQNGTSGSMYWFKGYIDDLRITNGVARYTADFTPPTEAFPDGGYEVGGTVVDINGNPVARTFRAYRRDTGALLGTGVSNASTGTYNIAVDHDGEVQVVMLDDVAGTVENDQILRTTPV